MESEKLGSDVFAAEELSSPAPMAGEEALPVGAPENKRKVGSLRRGENLIGWAYISPMVIGILVFTAIPLVMSIMAMFYNWNGVNSLFSSQGAGMSHFQSIFGGLESARYWNSLLHTLVYAIQLPVGLVLGIFLALAMNRDMHGVQVFRIIYYLPGVMSIVAVSIVWQTMFKGDGYINGILGALNMGSVDWLTSKTGIAFTINLLLIWKGVGYTTLMLIAGLQSVSTDQLEAARIDGANAWVILIKITVPALYPIIFYLFVTGLMGSLQMFNEPFILLGDGYGPGQFGMTTVGFVYYHFGQKDLGLASVGAWILALLIFIITAIQMYADKKREVD